MRSLLRAGNKGLQQRQAAQRAAIHTVCRPLLGSSSHASAHVSKGQAAMLWQQVRYARKARGAPSSEETAPAEPRGEMEGVPEDFELPDVPAEILAEWEKDPSVQKALNLFASQELKGKRQLSYRDVAKMLESMGCDKETFLNLFQPDDEGEDDEEIMGKGKGGKGGGKGDKGGKGGMFEADDDFADFGKGKYGGKGGKGGFEEYGGGSKGKGKKGGYDDSDDEYGGGGKSKGKGKKGHYERDDFDDFGGGKSKGKGDFGGGGKSKGKGKKGGFDDYGGFDDFGGGGKSKGGGGKGKGKKGGKY